MLEPAPPPLARGCVALIPAHNEAPRIGVVVAGTSAHLPVVVVDDGSSDATAAVARASGATVLEQRPNQGKGAALRAGFRHALEAGFDAAVTLDGDGQHDPAEIPKFLGPLAGEAGGVELVIGERSFGAMPLVRRLSNATGTLLLSAALG
ncbi:MAG TPA: glycosyltransferase family 2 protein, partial [Candidatus Limnocylindrales bacterium]|nr:glycosyltransferase family 2 protein [Candidatus Limnocylindrales bacterium]